MAARQVGLLLEDNAMDVDALKIDRLPIWYLRHFADGQVNLSNQRQKVFGCDLRTLGCCIIQSPLFVYIGDVDKVKFRDSLVSIVRRCLPVSDVEYRFLSTAEPRHANMQDVAYALHNHQQSF